jgi:signal transduction histidine kinase
VPQDIPLAEQPGRLTEQPGQLTEQPGQLTEQPGQLTEQPGQLTEQPGLLAEPSAEPAEPSAWATYGRRMEQFYGVVFLASLLLVGGTTSSVSRTLALAAIGAMAVWYLLLGRRVRLAATPDAMSSQAIVYTTGLVLLFAFAVLQVPNTWFLGFALFPHISEVVPFRRVALVTSVMNLIAAFSVGYHDRTVSGIATAAAFAIMAIAFSMAFGGYITRIITQSEERADLIAQLEETRAELAEVSREAGALAERQRLATDIHDTLAQGFSSIVMLIQAAEAELDRNPDTPAAARGQLSLAEQTARENLAEARTLVGGLAPAALQAGTLEDALRRITERAGAELGITASFDSDGTGHRLPAATEVVLLRTGQEALANVRKHAAARQVAVRLRYARDRVSLEVTDDGAGFDPELVNGGYGLAGMRARVDEAGGTVAVRSAPAQGTSVRVEVPT